MRRGVLGAVLAALVAGVVACAPAPEDAAAPPDPTPAPSRPAESPAAQEQPPESMPPCAMVGAFHQAVESALAQLGGYSVTVDGLQSEADCAAIKQFQQRYGLRPVDGIAGQHTHDVAARLLASDPARCDAGPRLTACIDLTNQTTWLMRGGSVVYGPTVTRTGMKDFATPTGTYQVDWRALRDWSVPYKVWLPYWQSFDGGIGFHETTSYLHHAAIGSHGCVNLLPEDAIQYWQQLGEGSPVHVFGHRPGT